MDVKQQIGYKIKRLRQKRGFTQEKLAEMTNISTRTLSGIELGENFMTAQTMENILSCLGVSMNDLFTSDHLRPTEDLLADIESTIDTIRNDRDKVESIYKIVKAITAD